MRPRGLEQARRLYRARRHQEVLRLLEPQIFRYRTDPTYYALLGLACLHTGELGGAATYLGRASQLDDQNVEVLLGLAAVHLKRREAEGAVACWLRVLDLEPKHPIAQRGLNILRSSGGAVPEELVDSPLYGSLVPRERRRHARWLLLAVAVLAASAGAAYAVVRILRSRAIPARPGIETIAIPAGRVEILAAMPEALITMTERELLRSFSRAKRYLLDYRDNLATHEINRILLSNASAAVKERAQLLKSYAEEPDFSTIRDPFPFAEVRRSPPEYTDCYVRWSGSIANVAIGKEAITFDLLVGYQDGRFLEGVVPVTVPFAVAVENGLAYEVLGKLRVVSGTEVALDAVSVRPIASRVKGGS